MKFKKSLLEDINDGWELEDTESGLLDLFDDLQRVAYELKNCIRGSYTKCTTYKELSMYLKKKAEELDYEADAITFLDESLIEDIDTFSTKVGTKYKNAQTGTTYEILGKGDPRQTMGGEAIKVKVINKNGQESIDHVRPSTLKGLVKIEENLTEDVDGPILTPETKFKDAYTSVAPDDYQLDKIHPNKTLADIWTEMQEGANVYEIASVDGTGFDSVIRETLFTFISDAFNISYDDVYNVWMNNGTKKLKEDVVEETKKITTERTLDQFNDAKAYDNLVEVAGMLTESSVNDWGYEVEDCYLDYGQKWMWTTIICYCTDGHTIQVLNPKEWKEIVNATSQEELNRIVEEIKSDEYFQDRIRN